MQVGPVFSFIVEKLNNINTINNYNNNLGTVSLLLQQIVTLFAPYSTRLSIFKFTFLWCPWRIERNEGTDAAARFASNFQNVGAVAKRPSTEN